MKIYLPKKVLSATLACALAFGFVPLTNIAKDASADESKSLTEEEMFGGTLKSPEEVAAQVSSGGLVSLVDKSSQTEKQAVSLSSNNDESLPSKVDLRERGIVSSVKNQSPWGTCWAFGTNAAAEISMASALGLNTSISGSTLQTAWFGMTQLSNDTSELKGTEVSQAGEGSYASSKVNRLNVGAVSDTAASEFFSGIGVASASSIPYQNSSGTTDSSGDWSLTSNQRRESIARLSKYNYIGNATTKASGDYVSTKDSVITSIKKEINAGRGVSIGYKADIATPGQKGSFDYMNQDNWCQYNYLTEYSYIAADHEVCIVGYDDNYPATNFNEGHQPPANGAYIVKNSWGGKNSTGSDYSDDWGIDGTGYFYLSYYDHSLESVCSFEFDSESISSDLTNLDNEIIDQYDYLQVNSIMKTDASGYMGSKDAWYSNVFTASENQKLHHIVTYYCEGGVDLKYKVYKLKDDATSPSDVDLSEPVAEGTYNDEYEGYTSIKLENPVILKKGEKYAICFSQRSTSGYYYFPRGVQASSDTVDYYGFGGTTVVNKNESFKSSDDGTTWKTNTSTRFSGYAVDNYCVKGYATVVGDQSSETEEPDQPGGSDQPSGGDESGGTDKPSGGDESGGSEQPGESGGSETPGESGGVDQPGESGDQGSGGSEKPDQKKDETTKFTVNISTSEKGLVTLNKTQYKAGETAKLTIKGESEGNNIKLVKSVKVDGVAVKTQSQLIDKTTWLSNNDVYKQKMGETTQSVEFDNVVKNLAAGVQVDIKNLKQNSKIEVDFENLVPVYRLYNSVTSEHLFTTDKTEYDNWVLKSKNNEDFWIGEGIDWFAPTTGEKVYRLYNPNLGLMGRSSHYYTSDATEVATLTSKYGWKKESESYGFMSGGDTPIFTCYNELLGSAHHYTSNETEWRGLAKNGWDIELSKNGKSGVFSATMSSRA